MKGRGIFYGVGVGPGDPDLITIKALRTLEASPVIAVPSSDPGLKKEGLALSVLKKALDISCKEVLKLHLPMTRDREALRASREDAADKIVRELASGRNVSFVTLGDPMLYSTFSYLVPLVKRKLPGVAVEVIPGVTSVSVAASRAVIPLAWSGEKVLIVPLDGLNEIEGLLEEDIDTLVLMKVNKDFDSLVRLLISKGLEGKSVFVSKAGWPGEEVSLDLKSLIGKKADYFSMVIVRKNGL